MDKLFKVSEGIYRSARPDCFGVIEDIGIKSRLILEDYYFRDEYPVDHVYHYPMSGIKLPSAHELNRNIEFMRYCKKPLLINCRHGVDRTGITVATYRIKVLGWSIESAWDECRRLGMSKFLWWWKSCLKNL